MSAAAREVTKEKLTTRAGVARWWNSIMGDSSYLERWMPDSPVARAYTDQNMGCWRLAYGMNSKSVSGTFEP